MTNYEVVQKLVGKIRPVGESNTDAERFENLKAMCELMDQIHSAIDAVAYDFRNDHQASVKRSVQYANDFLDKIGIKQ